MQVSIGQKIKTIRITEKLTQKDFCVLLNGLPISTLSQYENNYNVPSFNVVSCICRDFPFYTLYLMHDKMPHTITDDQVTPVEKKNRDLNIKEV